MQVATTPEELRAAIGNQTHFECGFVPTMGALHEGHLALIRRAAELASPVVVSIFVNPTQFGAGEDFEKYPRSLEADLQAAESAGAGIVFTPSVEAMYPEGPHAATFRSLPEVARKPGLEDAHRPGHFAGVCQVVARLFDLVKPGAAVFGEKDYQQLLVIEAMAHSESKRWPGLTIVPHPTVREADGLAMSSRNRYLTPEQRQRALGLSRALRAAQGARNAAHGESLMQHDLESHNVKPDYAVIRNAQTLQPIQRLDSGARALIAARIDDVRLIDNAPIAPDSAGG